MKFLLIGLGGIGQRHARNLRTLYGADCELVAYRVRATSPLLTDALEVDDRGEPEARYGIRAYHRLEDALAETPDAALICNPSSMHMPVALAAAKSGCHLFIEKPVSHSVEGIEELAATIKAKGLVSMVGYQLRFHPCLVRAHHLLKEGAIGRPVACRATVGEYLPGWHRYEDYRSMYASRRALGGGVVLSQIHELDMLYWFFGRPERVVSIGGHLSELEIDVEDVASTLLSYDRMAVHLHQDYLQQPASRQFEIVGIAGKIMVDLRSLTVKSFGETGDIVEDQTFAGFERNNMFLDEMKSFTAAIEGGPAVPVDIHAGRQSLEMALAIHESLATRSFVDMRVAQ